MSTVDQSIAHYNLLEHLGAGGLGDVYRARDTKVGRTVALKLLPAEAPGVPARGEAFRAAVREAATLSHPNIATLFDAGEYAGRSYLVYEFVSGVSLRQEIGGRAVNPRRALELGIQIADALAEAHARDIVHGDIRPETIMVTAKGSAKVLDFGLSRWTSGGVARAAAASAPDGLPPDAPPVAPYLSPEQALGSPIDARSDLFSMGAALYEMLTGRVAFGPLDRAVLNVIRITPPRPSEVNPQLPAELDGIVGRALSKDLDGRYQSAASFGAELRSVAAVLDLRAGEASPADLMPLDDEPASRGWILVLLLILIVAALLWFWRR
jgi:serine/threonine protein kinase